MRNRQMERKAVKEEARRERKRERKKNTRKRTEERRRDERLASCVIFVSHRRVAEWVSRRSPRCLRGGVCVYLLCGVVAWCASDQ